MPAMIESLQRAIGDRYLLHREIGRGAMALVYGAHDRRFDRPVAVKVLRPELGASVSADRFLLEIETAARLQHPYILPIYDAGGAGGLHYYVMPLVEGESLRARLARDTRLSWSDAFRITEQVAEALEYAHARRIVHRDIKPENILLHEGHAMVADFGIAKVLDAAGDLRLTHADSGIGTPAYMSPEQAFGEGTLDGRSDLYSLACMLYEMLEGATPFGGATLMAILAEKATGSVSPLRGAHPRVPAHVEAVLRRAMALAPEARFATVAELVDALRAPMITPVSPDAVTSTRVTSLAVLPLATLGGDRDDEFLGDGITEDLIHALAQVPGLRVAGRTSSFSFRGGKTDLRDAGATLGVDAILDGTLRRRDDRLRIVVHLTDVRSGFELWSDRFDRRFTDLFDVQDEITRAILATLRVRLEGRAERVVGSPTTNMDAYEAYLKGRAAWNARTIASMQEALGHLERAIALDVRFAIAYAAIADCHVTLALYGAHAPMVAMPAAERAISDALALHPGLPEALTARASVEALYHWRWDAAEQDFQQAIRLGASQATTRQWYAMHLLAPQRRFADAIVQLESARQLDPLSPVLDASLAMVHGYAEDFETALALLDATCRSYPDFLLARYFRGVVATAAGRFGQAIAELSALVQDGTRAEIVAALGVAQALAGETAAARAWMDRLHARARGEYLSPVLLAQLHAALGDRDEALARLDDAIDARATDLTLLTVRPAFVSLRSDPAFAAIVQRLGLPAGTGESR